MTIQFQLLLCNCKPISLLRVFSQRQQHQHEQHQNQVLSISSRRQMLTTAAGAAMLFSCGFCFQGVDVVAAAKQPERLRHLPSHSGVVLLHIANLLPAAAADDHHPAIHGFYVRTRPTSLQVKAGVSAWVPQSIFFDEEKIFNSRSKENDEGSIAGDPAVLLYTSAVGETCRLIPLTNSQLPGDTPPHKGSSSRASSKGNRPRFFDTRAESMCWAKAETVPGRDPDRWRKDTAGNIVFKSFHNCQGCLCFQYDHIVPYSRGGLSVVENCQILQTRVNRLKSDKEDIITNQLKSYSCDITFNDYQLDIIEISFYGNILRPGNECRVRSVDESRGNHKSEQIADCKLP